MLMTPLQLAGNQVIQGKYMFVDDILMLEIFLRIDYGCA